MVELASPAWLILLPAPLLVWWLATRRQAREPAAGALLHPLAGLVAQAGGPLARGRRPPWLWLLGCLLLVLALARPQWLAPGADAEPRRNVVFAVDVSGSMRALDYQVDGRPVSRLELVRLALKRFLGQARDLRVALVVFADGALPFMPLTADLPLAASMVDEIDNSLAGERTALGDALAQSIKRMQSIEGAPGSRALVLMTDGIGTAGAVPPEAAAALARAQGIRVYALGIGSEGKVPFPLTSPQDLIYTELPLDEALLRRIAADTGGAYFRIRDAADMDGVLARIDALERSEAPGPPAGDDWYWLPAIAGLVLLTLAERRRAARMLPA
jgi:Ca-activated chloride channel family protein